MKELPDYNHSQLILLISALENITNLDEGYKQVKKHLLRRYRKLLKELNK